MSEAPAGNFATILTVFKRYRLHIIGLSVLGFLGAFLDGIAINAAIPSLSFLSGGEAGPMDFISNAIAALFGFFGVPFTFRYLIGFIVILFLIRAIVMVVFGYLRGYITSHFLKTESSETLGAMLRASWPFLVKQKIGHTQNMLERDIQRSASLLESIGQVIQSFTGLLIYLVIAFNISPYMTAFTVVGGAVLLFVARPMLRKTQRIGNTMATTEKEISQYVSERIIGLKTVKAAGVEEAAYREGTTLFEQLRQLYVRLSITRSLGTSFFQPFAMIFVLILFTVTYTSGTFNLIAFAATLYLIQKTFTYLESGQAALHGVRELLPYAAHVQAFRADLAEHRESKISGTRPFSLQHGLSIESVSLTLGERTVLDNVSLRMARGEILAVIGPSGAGKTSLVDLVLRLHEPHTGRIAIDGVALPEISLPELRRKIGYVSQDVFLFNGSIRENIRFMRPDITDEMIARAAEGAHLNAVLSDLREGLDTMVGDRGMFLSGGQRQRIALARALAGEPELLVLDEATSALDQESERAVQESIEALRGKLTVLVIAHRLSTIERADYIVVLDAGKVIEEGKPAALAQNPHSYYARHRPARG